jgi:hypothetical protein
MLFRSTIEVTGEQINITVGITETRAQHSYRFVRSLAVLRIPNISFATF